jgi:hypothetical protein
MLVLGAYTGCISPPPPPPHTRGNTLPFLGVRFVAYNKNPNKNTQAIQGSCRARVRTPCSP